MADFSLAFYTTLEHEGVRFTDGAHGNVPIPESTGYVNDPDDSGKETNFGVTRAVALENGYNGPMKDIPFVKVKEIYEREYWNHLRCREIQSQAIAEKLFDTAVHCGRVTAGKFLQRALNLVNKQATLWDDIVVDGGVGPITIRALSAVMKQGPRYFTCVWRFMDGFQINRYAEICEANPTQEKYVGGWMWNRAGTAGLM